MGILVLNYFWYYLILRIIYKLTCKKKPQEDDNYKKHEDVDKFMKGFRASARGLGMLEDNLKDISPIAAINSNETDQEK
jgi:hypothetical protein